MNAFKQNTTRLLFIIGCLILLSFIVFPLFNQGKKIVKVQLEDQKLKVINNDLVFEDTIIMCHFVSVQGGSMLIGNVDSLIWNHEDSTSSMVDEYNFNNRYVHSFLIGEIPVTANLGYVVFEGYLPKENRKSLLAGLVPVQPFFDKETVQFFIDTLNARTGRHFRLPTNEEWEFAARGGMKSKGYKYSGSDNLNNIAWYKGNCKEAHSVRKKVPNELGIYDMSGNYWECTSTPLYKAKQFMRMTYESLDLEDEDERNMRSSLESFTCRGGAWDSSAEECSLDYIPNGNKSEFCVRLVLDY